MKKTLLLSCLLFLSFHLQAVAGDSVIFDGSDLTMLGNPPISTVDSDSTDNSLFPPNKGPTNNRITATGGNIPGFIFGGGSEVSANVTNNQVIVSNTSVNQGIYGGWTQGNAIANSVVFNSGSVRLSVIGGYGVDAIGNSVTINGGTIGVAGTSTGGNIYGGFGLSGTPGTVSGNTVTITGGTIIGEIVGGYNENGPSTGNTLNISGGVMGISGNISGGKSAGSSAIASYNTVNISGGTIGSLGNLSGNVFAGYSTLGNTVTNNTVYLSGGTIFGVVAGIGQGSNSNTWETAGNNLIVEDGAVTVGGIAKFQDVNIASSGRINVIGNRYALGILGGGYYARLQELDNNGLLSFYNMPYDGLAQDILGLQQNSAIIMGTYTGNGAIGLDTRIRPDAGDQAADRITFENAPSQHVNLQIRPTEDSICTVNNPVRIATINNGASDKAFTTTEPGFGVYAYNIFRRGNDYYLAINENYTAELGKVYSEASAAALAQLSHTPDLLLRNVLNAGVEQDEEGEISVFNDIAYSQKRVSTNSRVDIKGVEGLLGVAYNRGGTWSFGAFYEFFTGDYKTRNTATTNLDSFTVKADGDLSSNGAGLFVQYRPGGRREKVNGIPTGLRLESSVRAGVSSMDFSDSKVVRTDFSKDNPYYGATLGGGYVFKLDEYMALELYSHGIWTRHADKKITDGIGQKVHFHDADSLRILAGTRIDFALTEKITPFAGIAMDWETMGEPKVNVDGFRAKTADLSGVSGVGELGASFKTSAQTFVDIKGTGMVGNKEGIGGVLQLRYEF